MKKVYVSFIMLFVVMTAMAQWTIQSTAFSTLSRGIKYMSVVDTNTVWATAYDGTSTSAVIQEFTKTTNGGATWTPYVISGYTSYGLSMICAVDGMTAWIPAYHSTAGGGVILKTTDGGTTWNAQTTATFTAPNGFPNVIHFWNADTGFCMGDPNDGYFEIYTTVDGGTTWNRVPSTDIPTSLSGEYGVTGYYSVVGSTVWFTTNKSNIFRSDDYGNTWTSIGTPVATGQQFDVNFRSLNDGIIRMNQSPFTAYATHDGGANWTQVSFNGNWYTNDFCYVPGTADTWVSVGADATTPYMGISYSTDGGTNWTDFVNMDTTQHLVVGFADYKTGWSGSFNNYGGDGMFKYSGNVFVADTCSSFMVSFSQSADTVDLATSALVNFTDASTPAANAWTWSFGDGGNSTVQNPSYTYASTGTFAVSLIAEHGVCVDTSAGTVVVIYSSSIDENNSSVSVFPNPVSDFITVEGIPAGSYIAEWLTSEGKVVESRSFIAGEIINTPKIQDGMYVLHIFNDSMSFQKPIVIRR